MPIRIELQKLIQIVVEALDGRYTDRADGC